MGLARQKLIVQKMFNRKKFCFIIIYNFCIQFLCKSISLQMRKAYFFLQIWEFLAYNFAGCYCTEKVTIEKISFSIISKYHFCQ